MTLTMPERYEINALLEELIENGPDTFDVAKAQRLIALVPLTQNTNTFEFITSQREDSTTGHAAGVGDVEIKGETKQKQKLLLGTDELHRVGGYKLRHNTRRNLGSIDIELMWADTELDASGQKASLVYRQPDVPQDLLIYRAGFRHIRLRIPFTKIVLYEFSFGFGTYYPWKKPA
ncbi:MAG: hypothetical protein EON60_13935 [Alphaproteobacteria bacterium]|nr:MAG: hypothetical protein EON60_13935 [Alphaproteobacteria bacterium]